MQHKFWDDFFDGLSLGIFCRWHKMRSRKDEKIRSLKREIRIMQKALEDRNRALDAMHYVWCDGGCKTGAHRWTENTITEDVVAEAERNTIRLRRWFNNSESRKLRIVK